MTTFTRKNVPEDFTPNIRREKRNSNIKAQLSLSRNRAVTSASDNGEWLGSRPLHFIPEERSSDIHWTGCWVGRTVRLDVAEQRKILCLPGIELRFLDSQADRSAAISVHFTKSCIYSQKSAPEDGWVCRPKHVEQIKKINKRIDKGNLLQLVGWLRRCCNVARSHKRQGQYSVPVWNLIGLHYTETCVR